MRLLWLLLIGSSLAAQDNSLLGILHGDLLQVEGAAAKGELSVRLADSTVQRCRFDELTYIEKDKLKVPIANLTVGQPVEVISDRNGDRRTCYARLVRAAEPLPVQRATAARLSTLRAYRSPLLDALAPRGNLTYAGVVLRVTPDTMILKTRSDGQKAFHLREDTRFLDGGAPVEGKTLQPNMRVFIRAGKNLDDELEAYQVIWGQILLPQP